MSARRMHSTSYVAGQIAGWAVVALLVLVLLALVAAFVVAVIWASGVLFA